MVQKVNTDIGLLSSSNCHCHHRWIWRRPRMAIAETEREARAGAEGALGSRTRQMNDSVEPLCDVQRLWVDVGRRPATRRVGSGNRRAQAAPNAPLDHEELEPGAQKAYHSVSARLAYLAADRLESGSRESNACRTHTCPKRIGQYLLHAPRVVGENQDLLIEI